MSKKTRFALGFAVIAVLVAIPVIAGVFATHGAKATLRLAKSEAQYGVTSASEGSEKASVFGQATGEDPNAAADEAYALRAYPADEIPFQATLNSIQAWSNVKARGIGRGQNKPGQWTLAGPSQAKFPSNPDVQRGRLHHVGTHHRPRHRAQLLQVEVPRLGSGRRRRRLADGQVEVRERENELDVRLRLVRYELDRNAHMDPTDPSGNTLYAGTGEPNVSVDSGAGLGLYKTTDGGDTWTHLSSTVTNLTTNSAQGSNGTYTGDAFAGRAIAGIAVDPTNPSVLYVASARGVRGVSSVDRPRRRRIRPRRGLRTACSSRPTVAPTSPSSGTAAGPMNGTRATARTAA